MKHLIWIFVFLQLASFAGNFPAKPFNYVTDEANVIDAADEALLNKKLHAFQDSTSSQIFVYITNSLEGADMMQLSQEIFGDWDIGQKGKNNGVLIAVFVNDHKFRIHTGYGMEGILPDLLTKRIQDEDMRPSFKQNNYYEGINNGVDKLIYYSKHEYNPNESYSESDSMIGIVILYVAAIIVYFLMFLILHFAYKDKRGLKITLLTVGGALGLIPVFGFFILLAMLIVFSIITLIRKISKNVSSGTWTSSGSSFYSGSSWGSSSDSSSSWSSSDSGSDFGGGGGGDSGGGGSSSDW
ncbi:MAG: TPM domain-containing protein [Bacteroidetes bacterium]|nr:TPM domain-containing protein [Bacteroidota bacterium]